MPTSRIDYFDKYQTQLFGNRWPFINFDNADLTSLNFSNLDFRKLSFKKALFSITNITNTLFSDADLSATTFIQCRATCADFSCANLQKSWINHCEMKCANFRNANLSNASFRGLTDLSNSDFTDAILYDVDLSTSIRNLKNVGKLQRITNLRGADFRNTDITNIQSPHLVDFSGALLTDEQKAWLFTQKAKAS